MVAANFVKRAYRAATSLIYPTIFLIAFFATAAVVDRILGVDGIDNQDFILTRIALAKEEPRTDLIFVGTSRLLQGANPDVFDRTMLQLGTSTRSFNLSMPGASMVELSIIVHRYFEVQPCCVKTVVLEADFSFLDILRAPNSIRAIRLFNVKNAIALYRYVASYNQQPIPALSPADYTASIVSGTFRHYTNVGLVHASHNVNQADYRHQPSIRGFVASKGSYAEKLAADASLQQNYTDALGLVSTTQVDRALVSHYQYNVLWSLISFIEQQGAKVVLVRMPQMAHWPYSAAYSQELAACKGKKPPLIDFGNPSINKELFDPKIRVDLDHLNEQGAAFFSENLARRVSALMSSGLVSKSELNCSKGSL